MKPFKKTDARQKEHSAQEMTRLELARLNEVLAKERDAHHQTLLVLAQTGETLELERKARAAARTEAVQTAQSTRDLVDALQQRVLKLEDEIQNEKRTNRANLQKEIRTMTDTATITVGATSDVGDRERQEDAFRCQIRPTGYDALAKKGALFVVADGVGGNNAGEVASSLAATLIHDRYYGDASPNVLDSLKRAICFANDEIRKRASDTRKTGMATTIVCAVVHGRELFVAHVGDCRAYLWEEGSLYQLTKDHSWLNEQIDLGRLTRDEAAHDPNRNVVVRALGTFETVVAEVGSVGTLAGSPRLLLCTDGVYDTLSETELAQFLGNGDPENVCQDVIRTALNQGGGDNATAIVAQLDYTESGSACRLNARAVLVSAAETPPATVPAVLGGVAENEDRVEVIVADSGIGPVQPLGEDTLTLEALGRIPEALAEDMLEPQLDELQTVDIVATIPGPTRHDMRLEGDSEEHEPTPALLEQMQSDTTPAILEEGSDKPDAEVSESEIERLASEEDGLVETLWSRIRALENQIRIENQMHHEIQRLLEEKAEHEFTAHKATTKQLDDAHKAYQRLQLRHDQLAGQFQEKTETQEGLESDLAQLLRELDQERMSHQKTKRDLALKLSAATDGQAPKYGPTQGGQPPQVSFSKPPLLIIKYDQATDGRTGVYNFIPKLYDVSGGSTFKFSAIKEGGMEGRFPTMFELHVTPTRGDHNSFRQRLVARGLKPPLVREGDTILSEAGIEFIVDFGPGDPRFRTRVTNLVYAKEKGSGPDTCIEKLEIQVFLDT